MATIIKRQTHERRESAATRPAAYNLADMADHGERYLATVRAEAAKIVAAARQEAAEIRRQAEVEGRAAAEKAVDQALDAKIAGQMETLTPAIERVVHQLEDARQQCLCHWEASVVHLARAMASRLVRREVESVTEISLGWTREAVQRTAGASEVGVRLHPTELENLRDQTEKLIAAFRPLATAQLVGDPQIPPGGCRIETKLGSVDGHFETQLRRLAEEML